MSSLQARATEIRRIAVSLINGAGSGHPGSCLSAADILAALYFGELRLEGTATAVPDENGVGHREAAVGSRTMDVGHRFSGAGARHDRFVLSKGHACPALYAALHLRGFFDRATLGTFRRLGGMLQGSPTTKIPGVDATCGSLGQGFSIALGIALGFRVSDTVVAKRRVSDKVAGQPHPARVYVMLGDGELQEGEIWEGAMAAGHYQLGNLCAIVDYNKMQSDDLNERIMRLEPLEAKWRAFNWHVRAIDGHDFRQISAAFADARATRDRPTMIVAHTIKGKGVSYMEGVPAWHGSVRLKPDEIRQALADLGVPPARQSEYAFHG
jgi:transketolase